MRMKVDAQPVVLPHLPGEIFNAIFSQFWSNLVNFSRS